MQTRNCYATTSSMFRSTTHSQFLSLFKAKVLRSSGLIGIAGNKNRSIVLWSRRRRQKRGVLIVSQPVVRPINHGDSLDWGLMGLCRGTRRDIRYARFWGLVRCCTVQTSHSVPIQVLMGRERKKKFCLDSCLNQDDCR